MGGHIYEDLMDLDEAVRQAATSGRMLELVTL